MFEFLWGTLAFVSLLAYIVVRLWNPEAEDLPWWPDYAQKPAYYAAVVLLPAFIVFVILQAIFG